jgi:hypothetical protein
MAARSSSKSSDDPAVAAMSEAADSDLGAQYAAGEIGLTELNYRAAAIGEVVTMVSAPKSDD